MSFAPPLEVPQTTTAPRGLKPELHHLLVQLRRRIRSYVMWEGMATLVIVAAGLFLISALIDEAWFRVSNLEPPITVRAIALVVAAALLSYVLINNLVFRISRRLRPKALALVLEHRFPELDDRLILAVEEAERVDAPSSSDSALLLHRSIDSVAEVVRRLNVSDVFDRRPLRRAVTGALVGVSVLVAIAIFAPAVYANWWQAYGHLAEVYRPHSTQLNLIVLAPPNDRVRPLAPGEVYKHPRGANLTLLIEIPEGNNAQGKPWEIPNIVSARRRSESGAQQVLPALQTAPRQFRLALEEVREGMELFLTGGDFTNRHPFIVDAVDPPRIDKVTFDAYYPAYTGLSPVAASGVVESEKVVLAGPVAEFPTGTLVLIRASANKPIRNAQVRIGDLELTFGEFDGASGPEQRARLSGTPAAEMLEASDVPLSDAATVATTLPQLAQSKIAVAAVQALPSAMVSQLHSDGPNTLTLPVLITSRTHGLLPEGAPQRPDLPRQPMIAVNEVSAVRIVLEDTDQVASLEPSRFDLIGKADFAPEIKTQLRGVSSLITRSAVIPIAGTLRDDHGIAEARFDFKSNTDADWQTRELARPPAGLPPEFQLNRYADKSGSTIPVEWFDTATLDLRLGQTLTVAIAASDADNLTGPHLVHGDQYAFTIVTREELLAALYNQEINLRKRLEQTLSEMRIVREELSDARRRVEETNPVDYQNLRTISDRSFAEIQQNQGDIRGVERDFNEILEQLINNRVHTERQLDRIRQGILAPLNRLSSERFPALDRAIGELQLGVADQADCRPALETSVAAVESVIRDMESALAEMQDLAEFHEAIQDLNLIFEDEKALLDQTQQEQKRSVLKGLGDLLD